ncbi:MULTISPECIES: prenyltransferase/squalene oxidase repeat-containing protein [unclassified Actinopolyspora]|uniref:prenyltransferase/squalene oxidase repeat-containing protein n=1 Tax=unclassified Actinopolyspora TaxID=2639451 RepID=UPI0013F60E87|nr:MULTISPECIES: prenyltransferase/squalene oxidase repeat-containing protein [unclassified Actinopolyspora]NHD19423.1 prenyltransferase [Actinopolyspora sp. BKK2]NHE78504.1 prenyltransferase [Actinopolyspora sp. BKK1]
MSILPVATAPSGTGVSTGTPDLWCTYAAIRTSAWLDRVGDVPRREETITQLASRQNGDGGYAWSRGMASDAWATFYCTHGLADVGGEIPRLDRTADWLRSTWSGDAYAMMPGQNPDVWATHFSTRTVIELCGEDVPDSRALTEWLRGLQSWDGGLTWSPEHAEEAREAERRVSDVRACFYGVMAWRALASIHSDLSPPWDVAALVAWLREQQPSRRGFRFAESADVPCMWATYRAVATLRALGAQPADPSACIEWIDALRAPSGAFVRWEGYDVADVWASFCAIGSLKVLGTDLAPYADAVVSRIRELACSTGGFTYREPLRAGDALSTAAAALSAAPSEQRLPHWRQWLAGCRLPNEGGVMYMPARGSEVRCTLWALTAGACQDDASAHAEIARWLRDLQNPDGGFGYWEGRGSDLVSTSSAVEILRIVGIPVSEVLDSNALARFVTACGHDRGGTARYGNVPGADPTLRAGLQSLRVLRSLGQGSVEAVTGLLDQHRVRGGGFANEGNRIPDLLSSYEAVATSDRYGTTVDFAHLHNFVARVSTGDGTAWTPLAPAGGDPLADCLGTLLLRRCTNQVTPLPALTLS